MLTLKNVLGRRINVKVDADTAAGVICRRAGVVGAAVDHALSGATVAFIQEGLVAATLSIQGTLNAGSYLYWNRGATPTANALSLGAAAGDIEVAQIVGSYGSSVYLLRLNIGFPRAAAGNAQ